MEISNNLIVLGNINTTTPAQLEWLSNTTYVRLGITYTNRSNTARFYGGGHLGRSTIIKSGYKPPRDDAYIELTPGSPGAIVGSVAFSPPSDDRLKHNEINISNGLEIIRQLKPQSYQKTRIMLDENYNGDLSGINRHYEAGLIAQDILNMNDLSYCVIKSVIDDSGNDTGAPYHLNYNDIFVYGLAATKELDNIVKNQENEIELLHLWKFKTPTL